MKILVTGFNGKIGYSVAEKLKKNHLPIVCAVRNVEKANQKFGDQYEFVQLDLTQPDTFHNALTNVDKIFLNYPPADNIQFEEFIKTAKECGVKHVVYLSVKDVQFLPFIHHHKNEQLIKKYNIPYTFLRAGYFMQNLNDFLLKEIKENRRIFVPAGKGKTSFVDTRDIAEIAMICLKDISKHTNKKYTITGNESLDFIREDLMEETISLKELMQTIRKRLRLILSITFIAVLITGVISYFVLTPVYQASTQLLVNQSKGQQTPYQYNEVQTNLQLINTYNVIIKSPAILEEVIKDLDLHMTVNELVSKITVQNETNSQVVNLSVTDPNPAKAAEIANKIAEVFKTQIVKIMSVDNVSILSKATVASHPSPVKPKPVLNIAIALVVGLMVGVGLAFLLEYLDNTVKTEQDIEQLIGVPVLGVIAKMETPNGNGSKQNSVGRAANLRGETIGS